MLALQGFLLANGSKLSVDRMINKENAYIFMFDEQPIPLHVVQIARQGFVKVQCDDDIKKVHASPWHDPPTSCVHCVKENALDGSLNILTKGFDYGVAEDLVGIYTADANVPGSPLY